ncbi:unnamed protein product [Spodoptera exigua]|nr:unnamed protein product [Spodoptera exigua]
MTYNYSCRYAHSHSNAVWNRELELSAQRWADQCVKHAVPDIQDTCRDLGKVAVGQNIATIHGNAPGLTPQALVDVWYMELLNINSSILFRYVPSSDIGHSHYDYFTQLMWEESNQVGCGGVKFKERLEDASSKYRIIYRLVCNFAPAGNLKNKSVYSTGAPCSRCPFDGICDPIYTALCYKVSASEEYVTNSQPLSSVKPVMVHPELAEAKQNHDSTGHYFFPEEDEDNTQTTESYYDDVNLPVSDLVLEDLKMSTATNDFLDEILESDIIVESTTTLVTLSPDNINLYKSGYGVMKKFLQNIVDKSHTPQNNE